ncbi:MAG TPA: glycosyltransferase family 2 protein [Anaerolineales bacterium]|nr:glycosyltransferase family 2 protein [Anaerolineales bacterium]
MNFSEIIFFIVLALFIFSIFILFYIYIGYPVIVVILSKLIGKPAKKEPFYPTVTIVIPAFNEESVIGEKIENTLALDYPKDKLQIIVCDDASPDKTGEITRSFAPQGVQLSVGSTRTGKVGGINRGMSQATGEIFLLTDADILAEKDALKELVFNFADPNVGCVVAQTRMLSTKNSANESSGGIYWKYESIIRKSETNIHSSVAATGHFMAIRRENARPLPDNIIIDDFYLAVMTMQKRLRVIAEPKAVVWERPVTSISDEVIRRRRMTAGRFQIINMWKEYVAKLPPLLKFQVISHKFLRLLIPQFMILAFLSNLYLVTHLLLAPEIVPPIMKQITDLLMVLQGIFYFMAITGAPLSKNDNKKKPLLLKVWSLPYYLCATNFASLLGLYWHLTGKQTVFWQQSKRK